VEVKIEVKNLKEVQTKLEGVAKACKDNKLVTKAALLIERQAKDNATGRPGPNVQTGRLRASITIELGPSPVTWARVGTNVSYAPFVEFGHSQQIGRFVPAIGKRLVSDHAPAYPFMEPALEMVEASGDLDGVYANFIHDVEVDFNG